MKQIDYVDNEGARKSARLIIKQSVDKLMYNSLLYDFLCDKLKAKYIISISEVA